MGVKDTRTNLKVQLRGGFSDRNGINTINTSMQYKDFDERTRVSFVNMINVLFNEIFGDYTSYEKQSLLKRILYQVYMQQVDFSESLQYDEKRVFDSIINDTLMHDEYDSVLTLIEFICKELSEVSHENLATSMNRIFEREYVGYRFVDDIIVPITNDNEIQAIEAASNVKYENVNSHLRKALVLISDRNNPDYENSIKESISAVEAICVQIIGKGATLGAALKQIEKNGVNIHPSMKSAFEKLYGYTSDANGIRHAGDIGGSSSTFEEAKFMLVSCSAFINYLIGVTAN